ALQLLLGAQLQAEVGDLLLAALTVLAGAVGAGVDRGLRATPDVFAHPAVEFVLGAMALGHSYVFTSTRAGAPEGGSAISTAAFASTRHRSAPTGGPAAWKARCMPTGACGVKFGGGTDGPGVPRHRLVRGWRGLDRSRAVALAALPQSRVDSQTPGSCRRP